MPIQNDVSSLPSGPEGDPPVAHPLIVNRLAEEWYRHRITSGDDEAPTMAAGARWRASWSGMCARNVSYSIKHRDAELAFAALNAEASDEDKVELAKALNLVEDLAATNPPSVADAWRMGLGSMVHAQLQDVLIAAFPGADVEVKTTIDDFGSATVDIVIDEMMIDMGDRVENKDGSIEYGGRNFRTVVELKTINGFGYKDIATTFKGPQAGPKPNALIQGAVAAAELKADRLIIGYLSMECLSPDVASRNNMDEIGRFAAEWHYTPEQFVPLAEAERKRVRRIIAVVDAGDLPPRQIPGLPSGSRITNPQTGLWEVTDGNGTITQSGKTWHCGYCWNRDRCLADGPT